MEGPSGSFLDSDLPGSQGRLAFAALVVERRPMSRDELADIVWDERLPNQWNGALTTIVSKIRTLVSAAGFDAAALVTSIGGTYELHLPTETWVDLEDAYRRLDRAAGAIRHDDLETTTSEATVASAVLRRPLLAGIHGSWLDAQRRRQADGLYRSLALLAESWNRIGDHPLAAAVARSAIALDPLREIGHRLLMQAEWGRGDRGAALVALERCEQILTDQLGVAPSPETQQLALTLRS